MKSIQVTYTTNKGTWLADINIVGVDSHRYKDPIWLVNYVWITLAYRYVDVLDWTISKYYN